MYGIDRRSEQISLGDGSMRQCQFCRRELRADFLFCPFCGKRISPPDGSPIRWYHSRYSIVVALIVLGPFALPLVWSNPRYSATTKLTLTILILAMTAVLVYLLVVLWMMLIQQVRQLTTMY